MAFEKHTERAQQVVQLASEEANRRGADLITTKELLCGMVREAGGIAGHVLSSSGVTLDSIRGCAAVARAEPSLAEVEAQSLAEVNWLGHNFGGTEHLLLSVCCFRGCSAVGVMQELGVSPAWLCQEVLSILGQHEEWERWRADHEGVIE